MRVVLKIGGHMILCPDDRDLNQIIDFVSKMQVVREAFTWRVPTKIEANPDVEIKFELFPDACIKENINVIDIENHIDVPVEVMAQ